MTLRRLTFAFGLAALLYGGSKLGWASWVAGIVRLGPAGWLALLLLQILAFVVDAWALKSCAGPWSSQLTFLNSLRACVVAQAVNTVTPLGQLGEAHKLRRLPSSWPQSIRTGTVLLHNHVMFVGTCLSVAVGLVAGAHALEAWHALEVLPHVPLGRLAMALAVLTLAAALVVHVVLLHELPALSRFLLAFSRAFGARVTSAPRSDGGPSRGLLRRWGSVVNEATTAARLLAQSRSLGWALGTTLIKRGLLVVEVIIVLRRLDCPAVTPLALLSAGGSQWVAWLTSFVPGQLGTAEWGTAFLFHSVGAPVAMGLSLEAVRRGRRLIVAAIGLGLA